MNRFSPSCACCCEGCPADGMDVMFLCDVTGSMGSYAQNFFKPTGLQLLDFFGGEECAFSVVAYSDISDGGVWTDGWEVRQNFTNDESLVQTGMNAWGSGGGGDGPEQQLMALKNAGEQWESIDGREDVKRIIIWAGDAPGHTSADNPSYPSLAETITALTDAEIVVIAVDVGSMNSTGQITAIVEATDGETATMNLDSLKKAICNILGK